MSGLLRNGSNVRAQVLWGSNSGASARTGRSSKVVHDNTWGVSYTHYSPVMTDISVKAGSKKMILSTGNSSQDFTGSGSPNKGKISEDQLLRKYRYSSFYLTFFSPILFSRPVAKAGWSCSSFSPIYPLGNHFFCITALDRSKTWNPVTTAILDVPTAYAFFGSNPRSTMDRLNQLVNDLVSSWNQNQRNKKSV